MLRSVANDNIVIYEIRTKIKMVLGISSFTYGWAVGVPGKIPARRFCNDLKTGH